MAYQAHIVPANEVRKGDIIPFQSGDSTGRIYVQEYATVESAKIVTKTYKGIVDQYGPNPQHVTEEVQEMVVKHRGQKSGKLRTSSYRLDNNITVKVYRTV